MTEKPAENAPETPETKAPLVPGASGTSQAAPPSVGGSDVDALFTRLRADLKKDIDEGLQQIDRKWQSNFDKKTGRLDRVLELAKKHNNDPAAIQRDLDVDELTEEKHRREAGEASASPSQPKTSDEEKKRMEEVTATILSDAGIPFDDPKYKAFVAENMNKTYDHNSWELQVRRFKDQYLKQAAAGDGAGQPERGQGAAGKKTAEALAEDYKKEMYAARGQGMTVGREIKAKYRAKGLDVDQIRL